MSRIKSRRFLSRIGLSSAPAILLASCASGPPFARVEPPPPGKAAIYVYRPTAIAQAVNRYQVLFERGSEKPLELKNGSWARAVVSPGTHGLSATGQVMLMRCAPVTLEAGNEQVVFVELSIAMWGDGQGRTLQSCKLAAVPSAKALEAIAGLRRSE